MRILWAQHFFWPDIRGGAERRAYHLVQALANRGHDMEVLCWLNRVGVDKCYQRLGNIPIHRYPLNKIDDRLRRIRIRLRQGQWKDVCSRFLRTRQFDGAIVSSGLAIAHYIRRLKPEMPIVLATGGTWGGSQRYEFDRHGEGWSLRIAGQMAFWQAYYAEILTLRGANYVVAESANVKDQLVNLYHLSSRKVPVIGNGVDHQVFCPRPGIRREIRQREGWSESMFIAIAVGRLDRVKNYQYLIQAVATTNPGLNIHVVLVGMGGEMEPLRNLAQSLNVDDRIHFIGHRSDVPDLLAAADVFVLPSVYEAYGNAWLESLSTGLPSMGLRREFGRVDSAADEHIRHGETGFLLDPDDPGDLARRVVQLQQSGRLRKRMGQAARKWALKTYRWEETARTYECLLRKG